MGPGIASLPLAVEWVEGQLYLLDQTLLPAVEKVIQCSDLETVFEAIQTLRVRGAPAIGIAAAYGLLAGLDAEVTPDLLQQRGAHLVSARPTAVNLAWAVHRMLKRAAELSHNGHVAVAELYLEAEAIHAEDRAACQSIGRYGLELIQDKPALLTHCNAGSLAVSELGTALAPIYTAHERGHKLHVFVDETRPLLQGSRLTAFELMRHGVPHTLITDNMAAHVMSEGKVDAVIVGADRVAANGDVANKIGTLGLAILCRYFGLPFYVACPCSTVDPGTRSGDAIEIEQRPGEEVSHFAGKLASYAGVGVFNPAFDVTPAALVTALITDEGIVHSPVSDNLTGLSVFANSPVKSQ